MNDLLPDVMHGLAGSARLRDWPRYAASRGGMWTRATRDAIEWPAYLPEVPEPILRERGRRSLFDQILEFFSGLLGSRKSPAAEIELPGPAKTPLATSLTEAHLRLARKNLAFAARWFHPLERLLPRGLMELSDQGVLWALIGAHVRRWGAADLPAVLKQIDAIPGLAKQATLGDCVALHVLLEEWCAEVAATRTIAVADDGGRRSGGLRSPEMLRNIRVLRERDRTWWDAFQLLAARSPLTLLLYADLFDISAPLPRFAPLFHMDSRGSLVLWISHLARSLLAACTSPAPDEDARRRAERALERARADARARWRVVWGTADPDRDGAVLAARQRLDRLEALCRAQRWRRTILLGAIVGQSLFFHLRFLDFLIRTSVSACDAAIKERWKLRGQDHYDEPRDVFFFQGGRNDPICRHALENMLWGRAGDVPPEELREDVAKAWRSLNPAAWNVEAIAASASVYPADAEALLDRYERSSIALSIPGKWAHPPHLVWSEWFSDISNRIHGSATGAAS